jgi:predicted ester cyclase
MVDSPDSGDSDRLTRRGFVGAGAVSTAALIAGPGAADAGGQNEPSLKERRLAVVRRHMGTENRADFGTTLTTFGHPRYEFIATGEVDNGRRAVDGYYTTIESAFPDQHTSDWRIRYAPGGGDNRDAVVVEFLFTGTQKGSFMGIAPTGRKVSCRMTAFFFFPAGSDRLDDERVYFDGGTILMQLGVIPKLYAGWTGPLPH